MKPKGDRMETGRVQINTFIVSLGAVIAVEAIIRLGLRVQVYNPMVVLGAVRLVEAGLILMIVFIREKGLSAIGLSLTEILPGLRRGLIWSAGFGLVTLLVFVLFYAGGVDLLKFIHTRLPMKPGDILLYFIVGGLIGPITEEIFFRGVLYGFFRRWGAPAAILLSTLAFVLVHPVFPAIPITQVVGGLLFAVAYEVERNLMAPITIHVLGNLAIFTLSLVG